MASKKKSTAAELRPWRTSLMRARNHFLGVVYAPDEKAAEAAAVQGSRSAKISGGAL